MILNERVVTPSCSEMYTDILDMKLTRIILLLTFTTFLSSCAKPALQMNCVVTVPTDCYKLPFPPPKGEPESIRYQVSFEAFWYVS